MGTLHQILLSIKMWNFHLFANLKNLLFGCRTGVCAGQANGQCTLVHDKSKVAVCSAWLSGSCSSSAECTLQHKACPDLMPLCQFYLKVVLTSHSKGNGDRRCGRPFWSIHVEVVKS